MCDPSATINKNAVATTYRKAASASAHCFPQGFGTNQFLSSRYRLFAGFNPIEAQILQDTRGMLVIGLVTQVASGERLPQRSAASA